MNDDDAAAREARLARLTRLARLADGSLPASQAGELRAEVQSSPDLAAALAEQEHAVSLLQSLHAPAPPGLRARLEAMTEPRPSARRPRRRPAMALTAVLAAAVVVVALLAGRGPGAVAGGPTVSQTARLTLAAATVPAPAVDPAHPARLRLAVGGIAFPARAGGWAPTGARTDILDGRRIVTVFYGAAGATIGYAIVSGPALAIPSGPRMTSYDGYVRAHEDGVTVVTWRRSDHTCVISGRGVSGDTLLALARATTRAET